MFIKLCELEYVRDFSALAKEWRKNKRLPA